MLSSYFNVARRNLVKNKFSSLINIGGLAAGMAVAMLIGLWIYDETSYNKNFDNYDRLGKLWQFVKFDKEKSSYSVMPIPLAAELRNKYPDFQAISITSGDQDEALTIGDKKLAAKGIYVEPLFTTMFSLPMIEGNPKGLQNPNSIFLSQSLAKALFGNQDPMGQPLRLSNKVNATVTGVYTDFPQNSSFQQYQFLAPWQLYVTENSLSAKDLQEWDNNNYQIFAQLQPGASFAAVSAKIKETRMLRDNPPPYHPEFFVFPMSRWHLYSDFKDGVNTGGTIHFVWLFGIIGCFVLLLACINFMNLSTARSEKRAKEVGIRKAIGSLRIHLITQAFARTCFATVRLGRNLRFARFLTESVLVAFIAFTGAIVLTWLALPFFNELAGKKMIVPWDNHTFWLIGIAFSIGTGLIAGSYPAFYLSSFRPVKVLKGDLTRSRTRPSRWLGRSFTKAGRFAAIPRKVLVVLQFTVSVSLIIGTLVVLRQIQYAKDRSVGYNRNQLIEVPMNTPELIQHARAIQTALLGSGAVENFAASSNTITAQNGGSTNVGWQLIAGRDFSRDFGNDSSSVIINQATQNLIGLKNPLGQIFFWNNKPYHIIGVTRNIVRQSPFEPVDPAFFAALAIFISCLGLYGLVSFVAEQRTREIGLRKVLGATVPNIWKLLSREFMALVLISQFIAIPLAYYFMGKWLLNYDYRAPLSWWIFGASGAGALLITLITVSFEAVKAALANPIKSLRTE